MIWLGTKRGVFQDWLSRKLAKATGKRIDPVKHNWVIGPIGETKIIDDSYIKHLIQKENLYLVKNQTDFGLMDSMKDLQFSDDDYNRLSPRIKDFYEKTYNYDFEVWSNWNGLFKIFGWLIKIIFSRRLKQLNLPLNHNDVSKGIESNIIKLKEKSTNKTKYTIWYRIIKSSNEVIYSGIYDHTFLPKINEYVMKVIFPLPNGNGSVIMRKKVLPDGSFLIESNGSKFGEPGFYFYLTDGKNKHWANHIKSMHEFIHVYIDDNGILRTDHILKLFNIKFMTLHYKMTKKNTITEYLKHKGSSVI